MITSAPWVMYPEISEDPNAKWLFSEPKAKDGDEVSCLIAACPPP